MRRRHRMPFGAELSGDGARFRLWAPSAAAVDLLLGAGTQQVLPMRPLEDGWFERTSGEARAGTPYAFRAGGTGPAVPDPASRAQARDVHGPSLVEDPEAFDWTDGDWRGRPWEQAVVYELHVGAFDAAGDFDAVRNRLDRLAAVGITAVELMPLAAFPGARGWGYDGVLPFAPHGRYGSPDALKRLVQAAHARDLMVLVDVVYNHFGPEGNYLGLYARDFFRSDRRTPWGDAIDFEGRRSRAVRDFFIHNALYWLEEFHFDGLRIDAVHAIHDESEPDFLTELARAVQTGPGAGRHVHLVLENVHNEARRLERDREGRPRRFTAQWNDDAHHALHCLLTGEADGYYADFAAAPGRHLARALAEGFAFQGESSAHHDGAARGEPSAHLPPAAFVNFLQNHDQVGNRAFGERLSVLAGEAELRAATSLLLLAPAVPLLFMGEEWGCRQPFPFFCDFGPELARAVTDGRRREFARFPRFADPAARDSIPDPNARVTFDRAVLDWSALERPEHARWLALVRELLGLRATAVAPRLRGTRARDRRVLADAALRVDWTLGDGAGWSVLANCGATGLGPIEPPAGREVHRIGRDPDGPGALPAWTVVWYLDERP